MNQTYVNLVNQIYKEMKNNIDIIKYWFDYDNKELDVNKLFSYKKEDFSLELGNEKDIYIFVNKLINNLLYGRKFTLKKLTYLEDNFVSMFNIIIDDFNGPLKGGEDE